MIGNMVNIKYIGRSQVVAKPGIGTFVKDKYRLLGRVTAQKLAEAEPELFVLEPEKVKKKKIVEEQPDILLQNSSSTEEV